MWSIATSILGKLLSAPPHTMSSRKDERGEKQYGSWQGPSQGTEVGRVREVRRMGSGYSLLAAGERRK